VGKIQVNENFFIITLLHYLLVRSAYDKQLNWSITVCEYRNILLHFRFSAFSSGQSSCCL